MCDYCEHGKMIKAEYQMEGTKTMPFMLGLLSGNEDDDAFDVAWIDGNRMYVDNSSAEYAALGFEIKHCPFCGAELSGADMRETE